MTASQPTIIYLGKREDMIAEVAAFDFRTVGVSSKDCKWAVLPIGEAQFDTIPCRNLTEARAVLAELRAAYPGIKACWI